MGKQRRDHTIFVISCDLLSACVVEPCTCGEGSRLVRRMARLRRGIPRGRGIPRVGLRLLAACRSDGRHRGPVGEASGSSAERARSRRRRASVAWPVTVVLRPGDRCGAARRLLTPTPRLLPHAELTVRSQQQARVLLARAPAVRRGQAASAPHRRGRAPALPARGSRQASLAIYPAWLAGRRRHRSRRPARPLSPVRSIANIPMRNLGSATS